jgi:hypothetical protein
MKAALKSGKFWGGVVVGIVLLSFFPQLNPRVMLTAGRGPKGG